VSDTKTNYSKRSHTCGELTAEALGSRAVLCGWVRHIRDLGGLIFIRLADRYGETQVVCDPDHAPMIAARAAGCKLESVIRVAGVVRERPTDQVRAEEVTGAVELLVDEFEVLSRSRPLPFPITDEPGRNEELRLKHRYLDLRRRPMLEALEFRHRFILAMRNYLAAEGFLEIETPQLTRSTPEGARDFLVPSRSFPGSFYALPQSPQIYKQLLMVAGLDRYYQIARCFRDEDPRADRQVEFTQLDLEMSFIDGEAVLELSERLFNHLWRELLGVELPSSWPRLTYREALERYGTDKPDTRFGLELVTLNEAFADTELRFIAKALEEGGAVRGILVPEGAGASRKQLKEWENEVKSAGLGGMIWIKWTVDGLSSSIKKFIEDGPADKLRELSGAVKDDLLLACAGPRGRVDTALDRLRRRLGRDLDLVADRWDILWVTEFPLFEEDDEGRITSSHHPFTAPLSEDADRIESDPLSVRSASYDIVINGVEVASGSPRIHDAELQQRVFNALGISESDARERFGFFLEGLSYGAPPHAGIAPGLDRIIALMLGRESIREVIAFPKTLRAADPLTGAPAPVDDTQLKELGIIVPDDADSSADSSTEETG
jgi:aspartyl-tRNA synthetase